MNWRWTIHHLQVSQAGTRKPGAGLAAAFLEDLLKTIILLGTKRLVIG
jgi:hypothetical protein